MTETRTPSPEYIPSQELSGGGFNGEPLMVHENKSASMYDAARYKLTTPTGELAVRGADIERTNEELVVIVFADEEGKEHTLLRGGYHGISIDGVDFQRTA